MRRTRDRARGRGVPRRDRRRLVPRRPCHCVPQIMQPMPAEQRGVPDVAGTLVYRERRARPPRRRRRRRDDHPRLPGQPQRPVAPTRRRPARRARRRRDAARRPATVRAVVLTHTPPAFCAGADLKERASGPPDSARSSARFARLMDADGADDRRRVGSGARRRDRPDGVVRPRRRAADVTFALTEVRIGVAAAIISVPIFRRVSSGAPRRRVPHRRAVRRRAGPATSGSSPTSPTTSPPSSTTSARRSPGGPQAVGGDEADDP